MKKLLLTVLVLVLAFSSIAAALASTNVLKTGQTVSFYAGRAGVFFSNSRMAGMVTVNRKGTDKVPGIDAPTFAQKLLDVRMTDLKGNKVKFVTGPVYVYFSVTDRELRAFEAGKLGIFYYDPWKNQWTGCSTFRVANGTNLNQLACRIRVFGLYGLGN